MKNTFEVIRLEARDRKAQRRTSVLKIVCFSVRQEYTFRVSFYLAFREEEATRR